MTVAVEWDISTGPYSFGEEFSKCKSKGAIDPRGGAISDRPQGQCCIPNIEAVVSVFSIVSLWQIMMSPERGLYGPQGHG